MTCSILSGLKTFKLEFPRDLITSWCKKSALKSIPANSSDSSTSDTAWHWWVTRKLLCSGLPPSESDFLSNGQAKCWATTEKLIIQKLNCSKSYKKSLHKGTVLTENNCWWSPVYAQMQTQSHLRKDLRYHLFQPPKAQIFTTLTSSTILNLAWLSGKVKKKQKHILGPHISTDALKYLGGAKISRLWLYFPSLGIFFKCFIKMS